PHQPLRQTGRIPSSGGHHVQKVGELIHLLSPIIFAKCVHSRLDSRLKIAQDFDLMKLQTFGLVSGREDGESAVEIGCASLTDCLDQSRDVIARQARAPEWRPRLAGVVLY